MKTYTLEELGCETWLQLYHIVEDRDLLGLKNVTLFWPDLEQADESKGLGTFLVAPEVHISVDYIRARAFDELYAQLPLIKSVQVVEDLLLEIECDKNQVSRIQQFINKIPTRAK